MSQRLRALGGTAAMVAGVLLIVFELGMFAIFASQGFNDADMAAVSQQPSYITLAVLAVLAAAIAVPATLAMYRQHAEESATLGLVAAAVMCLGLVLVASAFWAMGFIQPWVASQAPELVTNEGPGGLAGVGFMASFFTAGAGFLLFGIAMLRAKVFPRWAGILTLIAGIVSFTPLPAGPGLLLGAALIGSGLVLRRLNTAPATARPTTGRAPAAPAT